MKKLAKKLVPSLRPHTPDLVASRLSPPSGVGISNNDPTAFSIFKQRATATFKFSLPILTAISGSVHVPGLTAVIGVLSEIIKGLDVSILITIIIQYARNNVSHSKQIKMKKTLENSLYLSIP